MPNNSLVIFLAGHGAVSGKGRIVSDEFLRSHHVILPAKFGGKFCYTAHNMIAQNLTLSQTAEELRIRLEELEKVYGVSSVDPAYAGAGLDEVKFKIKYNADSETCHLSLKAHRQNLKDILSTIDGLENSGLGGGLFDDDVEPDWLTLQTSFFAGVDFSNAVTRQEIVSIITKNLEDTEAAIADLTQSFLLREHALSCLVAEGDIAVMEQLQDRVYSPQKPYEKYIILSNIALPLTLRVYINKEKIVAQLQENYKHIAQLNQELSQAASAAAGASAAAPAMQGVIPLKLNAQQAIYVIPVYTPNPDQQNMAKALTLSQVLGILHDMHIVVSTKSDGLSDPFINGAYYLDPPFDPNPEIQWYDFTIPDDANIVFGACRDVLQDF